MTITVFAKKAKTKEGRSFIRYIARILNKVTMEEETLSVNFREGCGFIPDYSQCPCNIEVEKNNCNIVTRTMEKDGEKKIFKTMWISACEKGSQYEDHSTDDYFLERGVGG